MNHIFGRLAIGTAAWGKEYHGIQVPEDEQKRILDYCQCSGIDMIDTATAYEWDWTKVSSYFNIVSKSCSGKDLGNKSNLYAFLSHSDSVMWQPFWADTSYKIKKVGLSIYEPISIPHFGTFGVPWANLIQVPYSIFDRRFETYFAQLKEWNIEIHVRSIFLQGKILEKFKPWECIAFCLMNKYVDRVIIGVDSLEQLKENLQPFHRMNSAEVHDENILDPRRWEKQNETM